KYERLSEVAWEFIKPFLPPLVWSREERGGVRARAEDRRTIDGVLFVLITGCKRDGRICRKSSGLALRRGEG
ncbi:hypothetical protein DRN97_10270, partial [Methanosarcinales archaeon]